MKAPMSGSIREALKDPKQSKELFRATRESRQYGHSNPIDLKDGKWVIVRSGSGTFKKEGIAKDNAQSTK